MKNLTSAGIAMLNAILGAQVMLAPNVLAQGDLDGVLRRLSEEPLDGATLVQIESRPPDPRIIPALEAAFADKGAKEEKQKIASSLIRLGDRSGVYFEFLAAYVRLAIADRSPLFLEYDEHGRSIRGAISAEFENWCALNHKDQSEIIGRQLYGYPSDVLNLAQANDTRAVDLFQEALDSPYPGVIGFAVQGLGRLNAVSAIQRISDSVDRLHAGDRSVVASQLPWFAGGQAEQLLQRLVPIAAYRDRYRQDVQRQRDGELKRVLSRQGRAMQE